MKLIPYNPELLNIHIKRCHIQNVFSFDISRIAELFAFRRGEIIIEADMEGEYIFFLTSGKVQAYTYTISNKTHYLSFYQNVAPIFGEVNVLWGRKPATSLQAVSEGTCVGISVARYRDKLLNDNVFLRYICGTMAERLDRSQFITALDPVESRFADFVLNNQNQGAFSFKLSKCADLLDTSNRHLYRVVSKMCDEGILIKSDDGYQIIQKEMLDQIARGKQQLF